MVLHQKTLVGCIVWSAFIEVYYLSRQLLPLISRIPLIFTLNILYPVDFYLAILHPKNPYKGLI